MIRAAAVRCVVVLMVCASGTATAAAADEAPADPVGFVVQVGGHLPTAGELEASVPSVDITSVRSLGDGLAAVVVEGSGSAAQQAAALDASSLVAGAAPDRRFSIAGAAAPVSAADPWFGKQWDLWDSASKARAGGYGIDAPRAWTRTSGTRDVVVAVLDTGITEHPDLEGAAIAPGYDFVSETEGIDTGDGDGWDADPADPGDACAELDAVSSWHGTFVTGEIVAQRDRVGVVGAAPGVTVVPVRVLGACGGSEADSIAAIEWASGGSVPGVPANPRPAAVISMSLGSDTGSCPEALQAAVDDAIGRGSVLVAAAGNGGSSMAGVSPANCAGVVSVVASTRSGLLASYSNRGTPAIPASIAAPGGSPANPVLGDTWAGPGEPGSGAQAALGAEEGTSMAAPRVAAAIALLRSLRPGLDPAETVRRLTATATPFPAGSACDATRCGAGIVNAGDLVGAKQVFLRTVAPSIGGTARVGRLLTARPGTVRPTPTTVRYRWLRDGAPITGATARTYRLRAADAGHRVAVRVQALRAGALTSTVTTAARRAAR